jgi:hypothetical protein
MHGRYLATVNRDIPRNKAGHTVYNRIDNLNGHAVSWAAIIEKLWAAVNGNNYNGIDGLGNWGPNDPDIKNRLYALTKKTVKQRKLSTLTFAQMQANPLLFKLAKEPVATCR